ncbi:MAG: hypothetical protein HYX54_04995 [Chloroflexi bacterium]|nr:hypothetical protein [Chloroflexota bacterium]
MHFYELHEGEGDVFFDVMLFRDDEMDAEEFFGVVQSIRRQVQDSFETDTLVEAIAQELERQYGFVFISDDRLTAAVNVSKIDDDNFLADLDGDDLDDDMPKVTGDADYRAVYAEFQPPDADLN